MLLFLAWLLSKKLIVIAAGILGVGLILASSLTGSAASTAGKALALLLNYTVLVGFGEEILFRGTIVSQLNETICNLCNPPQPLHAAFTLNSHPSAILQTRL